jgi:hypothetical protein
VRRLVVLDLVAVAVVLAATFTVWRVWGQEDVRRDGPLLVQDPAWFSVGEDDSLPAEIGGRLRIESGCAYLGEAFVVWPARTRWDADAQAVRLPAGGRARGGDMVVGHGGEGIVWGPVEVDEMVARCSQPGRLLIVFNGVDPAIGVQTG